VFLASWRLPETDLGKPKGMCRDGAGHVVVIEPHYQRLNHFAPDGRLARQWGVTGTNAGQFSMPRDVAADSRGNLFVCEYGMVDRVQGFAAEGRKLLACFGRPGAAPGGFNRAEGLGIDGRDRVHVADSCNHRVQVFAPDGRWQSAYGRPGRGAGELSYPYDVAIDPAELAFVCEFGNSRIQVFDAEGRSREIIGGAGSAPGRFNNPWCVALDSRGNLYVADSGNHRVQKLIRGEPVAGGPFSTAGIQKKPRGVAATDHAPRTTLPE
jgi:DNA-binding beta-propeller fold protein YncE